MNVLLLTTCDFASPRRSVFERLTHSLEETSRFSVHRIVHLVLMQRSTGDDPEDYRGRAEPFQQIILHTPKRLSISAARNVMLTLARDRGLLDTADWLAFPDDDAWYPEGVVDKICDVFAEAPPVDVITCQYSERPFTAAQAPAFVRRTDLFRLVPVFSSNTLFVRRSAVVRAGTFFDERLGLGAPINGGEDLDFAVRAAVSGKPIAYCAAPLVGHRDRLHWVRSRYFEGSVCALARSAANTRAFRLAGIRKLIVGCALVVKGELAPLRMFNALRLACSFYRNPLSIDSHSGTTECVREGSPASPETHAA